MTATVLTFRPRTVVPGPQVVTAAERAMAAAWCAQRGPAWSASPIAAECGGVGLWVAREGLGDGEEVAWFVERVPAGLALVDAASFGTVGVFRTMGAALAALA